jgi:hypothetical protein
MVLRAGNSCQHARLYVEVEALVGLVLEARLDSAAP